MIDIPKEKLKRFKTKLCSRQILYIFMAALVLLLAGCSSEPDWVLMKKNKVGQYYVDYNRISKDGLLVRTYLYSKYNSQTTSRYLSKQFRSNIMSVVINCKRQNWYTDHIVSFNKDGKKQEEKIFTDVEPFYKIPSYYPNSVPKKICDYSNGKNLLGVEVICDHSTCKQKKGLVNK